MMVTFWKWDQPSRVDDRLEECPVCKGPMRRTAPHQRTCSRACGYTFRKLRTRKQKACKHCGAMFWPNKSLVRVCSRKCYRAVVGVRPAFVQATCSLCGKSFRRSRAALKRVERAFCSRECQHGFYQGERSPLFRGDKDPNRGANWNRLAAAIRERDSYSCRRCRTCESGDKTKLSVDHVRPWRSFEDKGEANHPDNLVSLCRRCHSHKTSHVERAWLKGDVIAFQQWVRSLGIEEAAKEATVVKDGREWRVVYL